jgi:hypothetical protein
MLRLARNFLTPRADDTTKQHDRAGSSHQEVALGIQVTQPADLPKIREALRKTGPGQGISVTVLRSGRVVEIKGRQPKWGDCSLSLPEGEGNEADSEGVGETPL